jgi:hypothetical protein
MSRRMGWAGHLARIGEKRSTRRLLVGKPERRRPLARPKMDLGEIGWDGVCWIGLAYDRKEWRAPVKVVMNFRVP